MRSKKMIMLLVIMFVLSNVIDLIGISNETLDKLGSKNERHLNDSDEEEIYSNDRLLQKEYDRYYEIEKNKNVKVVNGIEDVYSFLINNPQYYVFNNGYFEYTEELKDFKMKYFENFKMYIDNLIRDKQISLNEDLSIVDESNNKILSMTKGRTFDLLSEADRHIDEFRSYILSIRNGLVGINATLWWIDKVKSGGIWDYKVYLGYNQYYDVVELGKMSGESIGNFHYGYVGHFYYPENVLLAAGDLYQGLTSDDITDLKNYKDSPEDKRDIEWGCRIYRSRNRWR